MRFVRTEWKQEERAGAQGMETSRYSFCVLIGLSGANYLQQGGSILPAAQTTRTRH